MARGARNLSWVQTPWRCRKFRRNARIYTKTRHFLKKCNGEKKKMQHFFRRRKLTEPTYFEKMQQNGKSAASGAKDRRKKMQHIWEKRNKRFCSYTTGKEGWASGYNIFRKNAKNQWRYIPEERTRGKDNRFNKYATYLQKCNNLEKTPGHSRIMLQKKEEGGENTTHLEKMQQKRKNTTARNKRVDAARNGENVPGNWRNARVSSAWKWFDRGIYLVGGTRHEGGSQWPQVRIP